VAADRKKMGGRVVWLGRRPTGPFMPLLRVISPRQRRQTGPRGASAWGLQYGGPCFSAASALPLDGDLTRPRQLLRLVDAAVRRPRRVVALMGLLLRTPSESVFLSGSVTGQALREYFAQRAAGVFPKNRLCQGVLVLPQHPSDYLRGRHRQALRTNLRRAATAGIRCEVTGEPSLAFDEALELLQQRRREPLLDADVRYLWSLFTRDEMTLLTARDESGRALAVGLAVIDDTVCLIEWAASTSHEARWALHHHLVEVLIARRVRYLVAAGGGTFGALGFHTSVQHYQHLLGYELRHLSPTPAIRPRASLA
jgi:hypothetical protein